MSQERKLGPEAEAPRSFSKADILEASDAGTALEAYHGARRGSLVSRRPELMRALGQRLMELGHKEEGMRWTILAEETETAEASRRAIEDLGFKVESLVHIGTQYLLRTERRGGY